MVAAAGASGLARGAPVAVFLANRVLACSESARAYGVRRGMRRRDAQGRCPELVVCEHDPARDAREFEPVVAAVELLAPGVEVVRPGVVAVPTKGPAGYFGSEESVAERIVDQVACVRHLGDAGVECQVGAADGLFAAMLAARRGVLVEPGGSRGFLAPLRIEEIGTGEIGSGEIHTGNTGADQAGLVDLLRRLGIRTVGDFAALPSRVVATRFGAAALLAHRAARGLEERPPDRREPPPEMTVTENLDPPVDRVDAAAFVARALAERLHAGLARRGLACTRLGISARTRSGRLYRVWRCAEPLTPSGIADRLRWQLDGWLSGGHGERPASGVEVLSLCPEEVVGTGGLQLDLIDSATGEADARADRAFVRVQAMVGPDSVLIGVLGGGRDVRDRVTLVPWGDQRRPVLDPRPPWPGRIPAPSPSVVAEAAWPVTVLDAGGRPVEITGRGALTAAPCRVVLDGRSRRVCGWAGPWPVVERWWARPSESRETVPARAVIRMQVVLAADSRPESADCQEGEEALLLAHEGGRWWAQGAYP